MIRATWPLPIVLGALSLVGLVAALTGDGWRDLLGWLGLLAPLAALAWAMLTRRT